MDHALQTISYIADIGDLLVIMVRLAVHVVANHAAAASSSAANGSVPSATDDDERRRRRVTICCHVFESDEVHISMLLLFWNGRQLVFTPCIGNSIPDLEIRQSEQLLDGSWQELYCASVCCLAV